MQQVILPDCGLLLIFDWGKPDIASHNMGSRTIFSALCHRATAAAAMIELPSSSSSPLHFAQQLSDAIVGSLDSAEIQAILDFLSSQNLSALKGEGLSLKFEKMRQEFDKEELQLSERESRKLVRHSEPLNAEVDVVFHVQHYKLETRIPSLHGHFGISTTNPFKCLPRRAFQTHSSSALIDINAQQSPSDVP